MDQFLEDGVSEDVDAWVQTASILHSNGDALDVAVKGGRIVGVRGRAVDRVNKGRLGPKDLHDLLTGAVNSEADHRALAPNDRAFIKAAAYTPPHEPPGDEYPFRLNTGRTIYHFHTRTKTARAPQLNNAAPEAWVEINASDADSLGVEEGDLVRVESPRGALEAPARITGIREGVVFAPFHYGYFDQPGGDSPNGHARAANELTITEWDPVSKQPLFKSGAVKVTKVSDSDGTPAPAPTNTASAPVVNGSAGETVGGQAAEATETTRKG